MTRRPVQTVDRPRAALALTMLLLALLQVPALAFSGTSDSSGNAWAAATLAAPTLVTATGGCSGSAPNVAVQWTAAANASGYGILRATSIAGPYTQVGSVTATTFTDVSVATASTYYYAVRSTAGTWFSEPSAPAVALTPLVCL